MRINQVNKVNSVYKSNGKKSIKNYNASKEKDSLNISQFGKELQIAKKAVDKAPDIRMDKVIKLKQQMESGEYKVNSEEVVEKLVNKILGSK
ncbi:MAG: flagellar biosynthesis anti-sigma factor FlgM [Eubacteriales bacterium]